MDSDFASGITRRGLPRVAGTDDMRLQVRSGSKNHHLLALFGPHGAVLGIERSFALTAAQVGDAHSGKHAPVYFIRWKCTRTAQYHAWYACLRQHLPERNSVAMVYDLRERKDILRLFKPA